MSGVFYAHSGNNSNKSDWQLLSDHLIRVAGIAANNARFFNAGSIAEIAGLLHDLGKYTKAFQKRLEGGPRVDHATAGAQMAVRKWGQLGKLIAYAVAGHHAGLANGVDEGNDRSTLEERLQKNENIESLDPVWLEEISVPENLPLPSLEIAKNFNGFQLAFFIRMIFSCLVDADFIDTEKFYHGLEGKSPTRGIDVSLNQLKALLDEHLERLEEAVLQGEAGKVNNLRHEILMHARKQTSLEPGLFTLTVPTGGGKTLTSMAFGLDHAIEYGMRRVIYVIPFTSIIEQNADVFREVFSDIGDEVVLEHHSAFDDEKFKNKEETKDKLKVTMENWDAPVVVTTAVQFFESLFADRTSKCRKLHNITGSVIILDEAQMLPLKLLRPTMAAIEELARNYKCSVVLCTATQPALLAPDFPNGFAKEKVREIAPDPERLYRELDRVSVQHVGEQTDEQLNGWVEGNEQILIVVNNRRHARALFDLLNSGREHFLLTTLMCAEHRRKVLDDIRTALKEGKPCKVISTSLIEAGVDVSFPIVMRAETGLDSVAQAAGRCNRNGERAKDESRVLIFTSPEWKAPPEIDQYAASLRHVLRNHKGELLAPGAIKEYFSDVYWRKDADAELDAKNILKTHRDHGAKLSFPFQNIAKDYRLIESYMQPLIIPYNEKAEKLIERLRYVEFVGDLARKLQPFLVQVPQQALAALKEAGAVEILQPERFGEQFILLINTDLYSTEAGLNWNNPSFLKIDNIIV